ncbi:hypothetical protein [Enterococcus avium]|nr:hypothetical protein [Enterococcus avium]
MQNKHLKSKIKPLKAIQNYAPKQFFFTTTIVETANKWIPSTK